ncbi:MAG: hypothetical protein AAGJ35_00425 [Myxococcota bacterium]
MSALARNSRRRWRYWHKQAGRLREAQQRQRAKHTARHVSHFWLARAGFSNPDLSLRSLSHFLTGFGFSRESQDMAPVGRTSSSMARDLCGELVLRWSHEDAAKFVRDQPAVIFKMQHDESAMRLRCVVEEAGLDPQCTRMAKIQNIVAVVARPGAELKFLSDLQALRRKDARTISTSLLSIVHTFVDAAKMAPDTFCVVVCIGDGVASNAAAAEYVWGAFQLGFGPKTPSVMLLWSLHCCTHAANLCVRTALRPIGAHASAEKDDFLGVEATCSRVYRHLLVDYAVEARQNLQRHLLATLVLEPPPSEAKAQEEEAKNAAMAVLYGPGVLPPALLALLNGPLGNLVHWRGERSQFAQQADVAAELFELLSPLLTKNQERPVVTRFWLFGPCVQRLLLWRLLRLPVETILRPSHTEMRPSNGRRLARVAKFFTKEGTDLRLRVSVLGLRLTMRATSITGKSIRSRDDRPDSDPRPLAVRLALGEVSAAVGEEFVTILNHLHADPLLHDARSGVLCSLMTVLVHVGARFEVYRRYPCRTLLMCRRYNPDHCMDECIHFLSCDPAELDLAFSTPLRVQAWFHGGSSEVDAVAWLLAPTQQSMLECLADTVGATTLDVERKHNMDKPNRSHSPGQLLSLKTASRNSHIRVWRTDSQRHSLSEAELKEVRQARHSSIQSEAISHRPHLVGQPLGRLWWETEQRHRQGGEMGVPGTDAQALEADLERHRNEYAEALRKKKVRASALLARAEFPSWPRTMSAWTSWMEEHHEEVSSLMSELRLGAKNHVNKCLDPQELPAGRVRIHPVSPSTCHTPPWANVVEEGFYCLRVAETRVHLFASVISRRRWACHFIFDDRTRHLHIPLPPPPPIPLSDLLTECGLAGEDDVRVYSLDMMVVSIDPHCVIVSPRGAHHITRPTTAPREKILADDTASDSDDFEKEGHILGFAGVAEFASDSEEEFEDDEQSQAAGGDVDVLEEDAPDVEAGLRAVPGTHVNVLLSSPYFTFVFNPQFTDIRATLRPRWHDDALLGNANVSRTLRFHLYGDSPGAPDEAWLALRAWSLWRFASRRSFLVSTHARQLWWMEQGRCLLRDVQGRDLCDKTKKDLHQFMPDLFAHFGHP